MDISKVTYANIYINLLNLYLNKNLTKWKFARLEGGKIFNSKMGKTGELIKPDSTVTQ